MISFTSCFFPVCTQRHHERAVARHTENGRRRKRNYVIMRPSWFHSILFGTFFRCTFFSAHIEPVLLKFIWIGWKKRIDGGGKRAVAVIFPRFTKGNGALTSLDLNLLPWSPNYIIAIYWLFPSSGEVSCKCHRKKCITVLTVCHRGKKIPSHGPVFFVKRDVVFSCGSITRRSPIQPIGICSFGGL